MKKEKWSNDLCNASIEAGRAFRRLGINFVRLKENQLNNTSNFLEKQERTRNNMFKLHDNKIRY
jgi:hypothetical protein